jgi:uncharacterized protein HemY
MNLKYNLVSVAFLVAISTVALYVILLKFKELFSASNHISKDRDFREARVGVFWTV